MASDTALLARAAARDGRELGSGDAQALFAALLAGDVPRPERVAIATVWQSRRASPLELSGIIRALEAHTARLERASDGARTVLLPSCHGTRRHANLTALMALLLQRYGVSVLVHGLDARGCAAAADEPAGATPPVSTFDVFRELGIEPASSLDDAQSRLRRESLAVVPLALLAPGLARLLTRESALPPGALTTTPAKLVDPFGDGYRVIGLAPTDDRAVVREALLSSGAEALLFEGVEGEPFADPLGEARLESISGGIVTPAEPEEGAPARARSLPKANDAATAAAWIADVLVGREPVPPSIVTQLGCCLSGVRHRAEAA